MRFILWTLLIIVWFYSYKDFCNGEIPFIFYLSPLILVSGIILSTISKLSNTKDTTRDKISIFRTKAYTKNKPYISKNFKKYYNKLVKTIRRIYE